MKSKARRRGTSAAEDEVAQEHEARLLEERAAERAAVERAVSILRDVTPDDV